MGQLHTPPCLGLCSGGQGETPIRWEPRYRDHLLGEGLSERTVIEYVRKMRRVEQWCINQGTHPSCMSASHVHELASTFAQSLATLGQLRAALKYYWEMLGRDPSPYKAVKLPREEVPPPKPLDPHEARLIHKAAIDWYPEGLAVLAGLYLALRRETIATMRWDGFDREFTWYRFQTKNRKVLTRPVHPVLSAQISARASGFPWIFPGRSGGHVVGATINLWVDRVAAEAGLGHVQPHRLRHTALTEMNDRTRDIRATAEFAGHVKLSTTRRYTRVWESRMLEAMHSLDYFSDVDPPMDL